MRTFETHLSGNIRSVICKKPFISLCHCRVESKRGTIRIMRTLFVLVCSLALVCAARGEKGQKQEAKASHHAATHNQHSSSNSGHVQQAPMHNQPPTSNSGHVQPVQAPHNLVVPRGNAATVPRGTHAAPIGQSGQPQPQDGRPHTAASVPPAPVYHYNFPAKSGLIGRDFTRPLTPAEQSSIAREIANGQPERNKVPPGVASTQAKVNPLRAEHFYLPRKPDPTIEGVKFRGTGHIERSETWAGEKYAAFRDYHHEWHHAD
jgi:hypothetical protein